MNVVAGESAVKAVYRHAKDNQRKRQMGLVTDRLLVEVILPLHGDHVKAPPLLLPPSNVSVKELETLLGLLTQSALQVLQDHAERKSTHVGCYGLGDSRSVCVSVLVPAAKIDR